MGVLARKAKHMGRTTRALVALTILFPGLGLVAVARADPLGECWVQASDQLEVRACLESTHEISARAMEAALALATEAAAELDRITGRVEAVPALEASQQRWQVFRDDNCALRAALAAGGSGAGTFALSCEITMARERADELAGLASDRGYPLP